MTFIDLLILLLVALGIYAEVRRGLAFALFDVLRIFAALAAGLLGYSLVAKLSHSYVAGIGAFVVIALLATALSAWLLQWTGLDPAWGKTAFGRAVAGLFGALLGLAICLVLIPVLGRSPAVSHDVARSVLARPFVRSMPQIYYVADELNIDLPQLNRRAIRFEDEGKAARAVFAERINYLRLGGSMCIACRSRVDFLGYRLRDGFQVSPKFQCPNCGRTSDGCQTFQGFHTIYHHCPYEVARGNIAIDCGVWPNNRPVQPQGVCPVCGRSGG